MASNCVSLPISLKVCVDKRIDIRALADPSDDGRELNGWDQERKRKIAAMQAYVDEGLASGVSEQTMDAIAAEASARLRTGPE